MNQPQPSGVLEGLSRVLRELLRTPHIKQTVQILLRELDPENAPLLVRAIKEEDPELFLALLASAPRLIGVLAALVNEFLRQVHAFPDGLTRSFAADLLAEMPVERGGENVALALTLGRKITVPDSPTGPELEKIGSRFRAGFAVGLARAGASGDELIAWLSERGGQWAQRMGERAAQPDSPTAQGVREIAGGIERVLRENPAFVRHVLQPLLDAVNAGVRAAQEGGADE